MNETTKLDAPSCVGVGPPPKRMAILVATPEMIRELLFLPPGSTLIGLRVPFDKPGTMELKIEGAGWNTAEGCPIVRAPAGEATRDESGILHVDWKLPA